MRKLAWCILGFLPLFAKAQAETGRTVQLCVTVIEAPINRNHFSSLHLDSLLLKGGANTVNSLLNQHSNVHMRNYSRGGLSLASFRGGGAVHTRVYWNDMSLNVGSLGQFDMQLIDPMLIQSLSVNLGGASVASDQGAFGAAIRMNSLGLDTSKKTLLQLDGNSPKGFKASAGTTYGKGKWFGRTAMFWRSEQNEYAYAIPNTDRRDTMTNAAFSGRGLSQDVVYFAKPNARLEAHVLYAALDRDLPSVLNVPDPNDRQEDDIALASLKYQFWKENRWFFKSNVGFQQQNMQYENQLLSLNSPYRFNQTSIGQMVSFFPKDRWKHSLQLLYRLESMQSEYYAEKHQRHNVLATWQSSFRVTKRLKVYALLKGFAALNYKNALLPTVGLHFAAKKEWQPMLRASYSRDVRLPTFNDLFWQPGGNVNLQPETSQTAEMGLSKEYYQKYRPWGWSYDASGYYGTVSQWIRWLPSATGYWNAQNESEVTRWGGEVSLRAIYRIKDGYIATGPMYAYVRATNADDMRLTYVPEHSGKLSVTAGWQGWKLQYFHEVVGKRFVTQSNELFMPWYGYGDITVSKKIVSNKRLINLSVTAHNVGNATYQVMANRPMPLRWFSAQIQCAF